MQLLTISRCFPAPSCWVYPCQGHIILEGTETIMLRPHGWSSGCVDEGYFVFGQPSQRASTAQVPEFLANVFGRVLGDLQ